MNVISKKRILNFSLDVLACVSTIVGIYCSYLKLNSTSFLTPESFNLLSAKFIFPRGQFDFSGLFPNENNLYAENQLENKSNIEKKSEDNKYIPPSSFSSLENINSEEFNLPEISEGEEESHPDGEKQHPVIEKHISSNGTKCENFYVKNTTGKEVNLQEYLNSKLELKHIKTNEPQVLIMHTHTSESYLQKDTGFFYDSFYPRSLENNKNVTEVGKIIAETLKSHGINTIHSTVYHDSPSYNGSYARAAQTIKENLEKYPSIQIVIDIHRDSMGSKELGKVKPTFTYKNKKASQMMIICGCDPDGSVGFPNWEKNFSLGLKLQKYCETLFPGITRPLNFSKVKYNEHLTPGSLLIEIGSDVNTLKESLHTGYMLGISLSKMFSDLKN